MRVDIQSNTYFFQSCISAWLIVVASGDVFVDILFLGTEYFSSFCYWCCYLCYRCCCVLNNALLLFKMLNRQYNLLLFCYFLYLAIYIIIRLAIVCVINHESEAWLWLYNIIDTLSLYSRSFQWKEALEILICLLFLINNFFSMKFAL